LNPNPVFCDFFAPFNVFLQLLCISIGHITISVTELEFLQIPRHPVLSQVCSSETPESMKCFATLQLQVHANFLQSVPQDVALH
jgi:hypothetical protein